MKPTSSLELSRRSVVASLLGGAFASYAPLGFAAAATGTDAIRPFRINVPQKALDDLRRRLAATRWPDPEVVTDGSQGLKQARLRALVDYWQTKYDWRKVEARMNVGADLNLTHPAD